MSEYSIEYLNKNTLYGYVLLRGSMWHRSERFQGDESNHYPMAIPLEDVRRRLLFWEPVKVPAYYPQIQKTADGWKHRTGGQMTQPADNHYVILGSDDGKPISWVGPDFTVHPYDEWLISHVGQLMDTSTGDLGIASVILLKDRAVCAVSFEVTDNFVSRAGVEFRPWLMAATALDGSMATKYKRVATNVQCDNTFNMALAEVGQEISIRHTKKSEEIFKAKMPAARRELELTFADAEAFSAAIDRLTDTQVTPQQTDRFLEILIPAPQNSKSGRTRALNRRQAYRDLLDTDDRVAPWSGTAWGLMQAVNTYENHMRQIHEGTVRIERDTLRVLRGEMQREDAKALKVLEEVLS